MPFSTTSPSTGGSGSANTGDITFEGVQIIGAGTASGDGGNNGTIDLVPDLDLTTGQYSQDQYLIIDPTAPNHIHIRGGGTQDASKADVFIGGERNHVRVSDAAKNVSVSTKPQSITNTYTNMNSSNANYFVVGNIAEIYIGDTGYYSQGGDLFTVDSITPDLHSPGTLTITATSYGTPMPFIGSASYVFIHDQQWNNSWIFDTNGVLSGPAMGGLAVNGLYNNAATESDLWIGSSKKTVISSTDGEFLNDISNPLNQIATIGDIQNANTEVSYTVEGSTNLTQPTFNGAPLFTGSYVLTGDLVYFRINVDMDNITSFGTGVYRVTVPFNSKYDVYLRDGHLADFSSSKRYAISGNMLAGTNLLWLTTTAPNGEEVNFSPTVPITLAPQDDFHISGTYIKA